MLTSPTEGHTVNIRGTGQTAAPAGPWPCSVGTPSGSDVVAQAAQTVSGQRINQWYGFGKEEQIYYRVAGTTSTTGAYTSMLETQEVMPTDIGVFQAGTITISTVDELHTTDIDLWVYDANLNAILGAGNDGATINGGAPANVNGPAFLRRDYAAGVYYIAMTNFNLANDQGSPCDDNWRTGTMLDFPDGVLCSSTTVNLNVSFSINDGGAPVPVAALKPGAFDIAWFRFEVSGSVETGRCCLPDGTCQVMTPTMCTAQQGAYGGAGTECTVTCPQPGACCFIDLTCTVLSEGQCASASGSYLGNGTACGNCPPPPPGSYIWSGELASPDATTTGVCADPAIAQINVPDPGTVESVRVGVYITHTWQGDIHFLLRHVGSGFTAMLVNRPGVGPSSTYGFSEDHYGASATNLFWLDETAMSPYADPPLTAGINNVTGEWLSLEPMSVFLGLPASGLWELEARDCASALAGHIRFVHLQLGLGGGACYANCDGSTIPPVLNVDDFTCFINEFAQGQALPHGQQVTHYSNCDGSTTAPVLNVDDFTCFINAFAQGCP